MRNAGYYEIIDYAVYQVGLKTSVIAGNVQFNRLHWHDNLEIICCIFGSFTINVQGQIFKLLPGDLITIDRGASHEISDGSPLGLQLIFSVDASMLRAAPEEQYVFATVGEQALSSKHPDINTVRTGIAQIACMLMPDSDVMKNMKSIDLSKWLETDPDNRETILATEEKWHQLHMELYRILMCLARHKQPAAAANHSNPQFAYFSRCVERIHAEYDQPLSARLLADMVGFSESTIYRLFQKHMGMSFNHYLNSVRISAACGLIQNSGFSMTEISVQCGFSSLSNFYRAFHQFAGMSPQKYREYAGSSYGYAAVVQKDLMSLNRFQPFTELPYSKEDLEKI